MSNRVKEKIEVPQSDFDWALLTSAVIVLVVSIIAFLIFYFLRNKWLHRWYTQHPRAPPEKNRWFSWILDCIWRYDDEKTLKYHGLDTLMYFWIVRVCLFMTLAMFVYALFLILPFNVAGSRSRVLDPDDIAPQPTGTMIQTIANINPNRGPDKYFQISHTIMMIYNTIVFMLLTSWVYKKYVAYRLRFKLRKKPENYTVRISGFDKKQFPTEEELKIVIERIFGENSVQAIHVVPIGAGVSKMNDLHNKRFCYMKKKEGALRALHDREEERIEKGKDKSKKYLKAEAATKQDARIGHEKILKIDKIYEDTFNQDSSEWKYSFMEKIRMKLGSFMPLAMFFARKRGEGLDETNDRDVFNTTIPIQQPRKLPNLAIKQMSDTAYVTFRRMEDARLAAGCHLTDNYKCNVSPAVSPDEVAWGNHVAHKRPMLVFIKKFLGLAITAAFCVLWVIPVAFAISLSNLPTIKRYLPLLSPLIDFIAAAPVLGGIIIGFLPQIIIIVFFILLVPILQFIQQVFDHSKSESRQTEIVMNKFYWFRVINIFLGGILFNSFDAISQQMIALSASPLSIVPILGKAIPLQTNFFTQFVLINGLMTAMLSLLDPVGTIIFLIKRKFLVGSDPRSQADLWAPGMFSWIKTIPFHTFMFLMAVVFSTISPLLLFLALILFASHYFSDRYTLLYRKVQKWDSGGILWVTAFRQLLYAMLIYYLVMLGIFIQNVWIFGIVVAPLCFISLLFFAYYMETLYKPLAERGSLYPRAIEERRVLYKPSTYAWSYQHCALAPPDLTETEIIPENSRSESEKEELRDMIIAKKTKSQEPEEYFERNYSDGDDEDEIISPDEPAESQFLKMKQAEVVDNI